MVNCGSSSLKFDVFDAVSVEARQVDRVARGSIDRVGAEATSTLSWGDKRLRRSTPAPDHTRAFEEAVDLLEEAGLASNIAGVGLRVVHGGARLREPVLIDEAVIGAIEAVSELAPLHNRPALEAIRAAQTHFGRATPMVATFDTAFYASLPEAASLYAIPRELSTRLGIRRFGFHGLAHRHMVETFRELRPEVQRPRLITLQLGNGCSATASIDGVPVDTSMGFTPLEGLIMGTRSGDLDPAVVLFLAEQERLTPREIESLLNTRSGLLGLSELSSDMRDLIPAAAAGHARAAAAIDAFCYRATKYVGAYLAVLGGADALIFGGGIGENSPEIRERICAGAAWAGLRVDAKTNRRADARARRISATSASIEAWVLPVDEAAVIARDAVELIRPALEPAQ
jgi:acetate kinase